MRLRALCERLPQVAVPQLTLRRARPAGVHAERRGLGGPLALAVGLAVTGHFAAPRTPAQADLPIMASAPASGFTGRLAAMTLAAPRAAAVPTRRPVRATRDRLPAGAWVRPTNGPVTSLFGMRWGRMHEGIDFGVNTGTPVYAVADGTVIQAGPYSSYGNLILVRHAGNVVTAYAHLSKVLVRGGRVSRGQQIGKSGNTGHSTGPHLHFEVRGNGSVPVNPLTQLRKHGVRI